MKTSSKGYNYSRAWPVLLALVLLVLTNCARIPGRKGEEPLARVYDKYLYPSDMSGILKGISSPADSARIAKSFIDQWVKRQLLLRYAEKNVLDEHNNFQAMIEDYRASLLIYEYETQLIREKVDTLVTNKQLETYYNNNLHAFQLESPIVKALYIRMEKTNTNAAEIRRLIRSTRDQDFEKLITLGQKEADRFDFMDDKWVSFPLIMEKIPDTPENLDEYLKRNNTWESEDPNFIHFLLIRDFLTSGEQAPLDYISDQIRGLVLSKRKLDYIQQIEQEVIQDAFSQQQIEIYE